MPVAPTYCWSHTLEVPFGTEGVRMSLGRPIKRVSAVRILALAVAALLTLGGVASAQNEAAKHHSKQGRKRMIQRDYEGAIQSYNQEILVDPYNANLFFARGQAKHFSKNLDGAITDYGKAIYHLPGHHMAFHNRGVALAAKGKLKEAIADLDEAVNLRPKYAIAYNSRATVLGNRGENEAAIVDCTEAIRLKKGYHQAFLNRGNAKFRLGRFKEARADMEHAVKLAPLIAQYKFVLGDCQMLLLDYADAIKSYTAALETKDRKDEKGKLLKARKLNPILSARAYSARARAHFIQGAKASAKQDLVKACSLVTDFAYSALWLVALFDDPAELKKKYTKTTGWTGKVVSYYLGKRTAEQLLADANVLEKDAPESTRREHLCEAYVYVALLKERAGKTKEAVELYRKAVSTKVFRFTEHQWAQVALARLAPAKKPGGKAPKKAPEKAPKKPSK